MRTLVLTMAIGWMIADMAVAANRCAPPTCAAEQSSCDAVQSCGDCGAQKACQVICETKKVTKVVWRIECEDFCVPMPGRKTKCCSDHGCRTGCGKAGCAEATCGDANCGGCCDDPCASLQDRDYVTPRCGKVRTRKKLVKDTITCEVPSFKCIVTACDACGACGESQEVITEEALPAAPAPSEAPAPPTAIHTAPMPPVLEVSYNEILKNRP